MHNLDAAIVCGLVARTEIQRNDEDMKTILLDPLDAAHSSHHIDRDFVKVKRTKQHSMGGRVGLCVFIRARSRVLTFILMCDSLRGSRHSLPSSTRLRAWANLRLPCESIRYTAQINNINLSALSHIHGSAGC